MSSTCQNTETAGERDILRGLGRHFPQFFLGKHLIWLPVSFPFGDCEEVTPYIQDQAVQISQGSNLSGLTQEGCLTL